VPQGRIYEDTALWHKVHIAVSLLALKLPNLDGTIYATREYLRFGKLLAKQKKYCSWM